MSNTFSRSALLGCTAVLLTLTTACSGPTAEPVNTPTTEPSVSAASTLEPYVAPKASTLPTKSELAVDAQGRKFIQTTIDPKDPILSYNASVANSYVAELFTEQEVVEAQKFATQYLLEEVVDSILKGDNIAPEDKKLWIEKNKEKIDATQLEDLVHDLNGVYNPSEIVVYQNPDRLTAGYSIVYGDDKTQIMDRQIDYKKVSAEVRNGIEYIWFDSSVYFEIPVKKADGSSAVERVVLEGELVLIQPNPGEWKISGMDMHVVSTAFKAV